MAAEAALPDASVELYFNLGPTGRHVSGTTRPGYLAPRAAWVVGPRDRPLYVERVAGDVPAAAVSEFFAKGMLLNVIASMGFGTNEPGQAWVDRLVEGIKPE